MINKNIFFTTIVLFILLGLSHTEINAQSKIGVLILAHGGNENWNQTVNKTIEPLKKDYEVEVAFGMADPKTMQDGINKLENKGVNKIIAVPLFISSFSPIIRQNEYLFGLREKLADKPMLMDHSQMNHGMMDHSNSSTEKSNSDSKSENHMNDSHNSMGHMNMQTELHPLSSKSKIIMTQALDDNPLVVAIISDRIKELSKTPKDETLILVAHGPDDENDNINWVKTIENISDKLREQFGSKNQFRNIFCVTVRDDAPKEIYKLAKENLRSLVRQASKDSKVIVVPLLLSEGGIERGIVKRLEGLDYTWSGKTLLPDNKITEFIKQSVENAGN